MKTKKQKPAFKQNAFEHLANAATNAAGSTPAFIAACSIVLAWVLTGPLFNYSDTWQLVINTGTTIITFLMVFLIQKSQNKDAIVVQIKLNELVAADPWASNRIISIEDLTEEELVLLQSFYTRLSQIAKNEANLQVSHSIEEANIKSKRKEQKFNHEPGAKGKRYYRKKSGTNRNTKAPEIPAPANKKKQP